MRRSEAEVRDAYPDLLETEDPGLVRLTQLLDAGYGMHAAPATIREGPFAISSYPGVASQPETARPSLRTTLHWVWRLSAVAFVALALLAVGVSLAVANLTDLGKPVNIQSTASYFPLSGFHRVHLSLRRGGKPELLFLAAQMPYDDAINAERWPLVKALDQFGRLTHVSAVQPVCTTYRGGMMNGQVRCTNATFNLSRARYSSRYLTFVSKDLLRQQGNPPHMRVRAFQRMSPAETAVFDRFVRVSKHPQCFRPGAGGHTITYACKSYTEVIGASVYSNTARGGLPLIAIGDYVQTASQVVSPSDLTRTIALTSPPGRDIVASVSRGLPFGTVQQALIHQKDPPTTRLVENVNAEANIITALICHADGKRPGSVCNRPAIKATLKHVK